MNAPRCTRLWQVEAVRDRRLAGAEQAAFERHLETCVECTAERAQLARLDELAANMPAHTSDALARRRLRNELLRRANDLSVGSGHPPPRRSRAAMLALALAAAALLIAVLGFFRNERAITRNSDEPRFELVASTESDWSALRRGAALRLALRRGNFELYVHKLDARQSFVLELPDGELEVRGTRFSVEVVDGRTRSVSVSEGLVALRLRGGPSGSAEEVLLGAGRSWPGVTAARAPAATEELDAGAPSASPTAAPMRGAPMAPRADSVASARIRPAAAASAENQRKSDATADFAAAMSAFSRGDFATAEQLFLAFETQHPTNGHVEDTLFLRALTRLRRGDDAGAKQLAREYRRRYPNGFRAPEAERLSR
jgi:ferric-dicitrate binding protein FerR (iron transport regulator)